MQSPTQSCITTWACWPGPRWESRQGGRWHVVRPPGEWRAQGKNRGAKIDISSSKLFLNTLTFQQVKTLWKSLKVFSTNLTLRVWMKSTTRSGWRCSTHFQVWFCLAGFSEWDFEMWLLVLQRDLWLLLTSIVPLLKCGWGLSSASDDIFGVIEVKLAERDEIRRNQSSWWELTIFLFSRRILLFFFLSVQIFSSIFFLWEFSLFLYFRPSSLFSFASF